MATQSSLQPAFFNTDADFRAWGKNISDQLAAMGLVKTGDTGQINWATVVKPASANTAQGYEIWRFDDALQGASPVHIKIEYGGGGSADKPAMWFTVGTGGTNGAGTLQGPSVGTRQFVTAAASKSAGVQLTTYISATTSRLSLATNVDPASNSFAFVAIIERTRQADGTQTANGVVTFFGCSSGAATSKFQIILFGGAPLTVATNPPALVIDNVAASGLLSAVGADLAFSPWFIALGLFFYPLALTYRRADTADLVALSFTYLGAKHTFLPLGTGISNMPCSQVTNSAMGLLLPWE